MSKTENKILTIRNLAFSISGRRIVVASRGPRDEIELEAITKAYQILKDRYPRYSHPLNGEFKWCENPKCNHAFYARRYKIEKGYASFCSHRCFGAVAALKGYRKRNQSTKATKIKFICLKCRSILDRIPGSPATCPACLVTSVFITAAVNQIGVVNTAFL
jgi:hypothetical protein